MTTLQSFVPMWLRDRDNSDLPWGVKLPDGREVVVTTLDPTTLAPLMPGGATGNKIAFLGNSIPGKYRPIIGGETYTAGNWTPGAAVTAGQTINAPTMDVRNGVQFVKWQAVNSGVMGNFEPVWPLTIGSTVTDGTVVWQTVATTNTNAVYGLSGFGIAQALAGQPLDEIFFVCQSGRQSDTILAKLPEVLAANPDIIWFSFIFENDCWPGVAPSLSTISTRFDNYVVAVDRARAAGKRVIVQTVVPSGNIDASASFTGYAKGTGTKAWTWLNQKIRAMARARRDVILWEPDLLYVDTAQTGGAPWPENTVTYLTKSGGGATVQQTKKTDVIHPYIATDWLEGVDFYRKVLLPYFPAPARFGGPLDETTRSKNPLKGGTGGTAGANMSGTIAAGITINAYAGTGTGVGSLVARTDISGNWQRVVYTGTTAADGVSHEMVSMAIAPYAVGDIVQAFREIRVLANPVQLSYFANLLRFSVGSSFDTKSGNFGGIFENPNTGHDIGQFITADTVFVWKTPPVAVPAGTTTLSLYDKPTFRDNGASGTVDFGRESITKWLATGALV